MKKLLLAVVILFSLNATHASFSPDTKKSPVISAAEFKKQQNLALMTMVSKMSVTDYEKLTGKKMSFLDKLAFKSIKSRFASKMSGDSDGGSSGFNIGGFLLGLFLGLIGVLLSLISKDRNFRKWALIGWGVWIVFVLIVLVA